MGQTGTFLVTRDTVIFNMDKGMFGITLIWSVVSTLTYLHTVLCVFI